MNERELDRAIDAAAGAMMTREPSRSLGCTVMARVREDVKPSSYRRLWVTAAASVLLCAAIAAGLMYRTPPTIPSMPAAQPFVLAAPPVITEPALMAANEVRPAPVRRRDSASASERRAPAVLLPVEISPIEPLEAEPIAVASIDVPRLQPDPPVSIKALEIDELTIEPLAASND
jgi:hypothetical protein